MKWWQRKKDRTWDFEGRCSECGKPLDMYLTVFPPKTVLLEAAECPHHPGNAMILWPQLGVRPDIIRK